MSFERQQAPVLIAGGGIAGLTLAAALGRSFRDVVVVERAAGLAEGGAAISLWPNALAALDTIGLGAVVRAAGKAVGTGGIRRPDGSWMRRMQPSWIETALDEPLVAIRRDELLEIILASAVETASVRFGTELRSFRADAVGVTASLSDGSVIEAGSLVGADGVGSVVARQMHPGLTASYAGYTAWRGLADLDVTGFDPSETWGRGGEFGFLPLGTTQAYWFATENTKADGHSADGELEHLAQRFSGWHAPILELLAATNPSAVLRHDIYDRRTPERWSCGPVIVIGDAAHPMRPHLGQGGCQAIEDAVLLAASIGTEPDPSGVFEHFSASRYQRVRRVVRESALIGRLIQSEGLTASLARQLGTIVPGRLVARHLAAIGGRRAFTAWEIIDRSPESGSRGRW